MEIRARTTVAFSALVVALLTALFGVFVWPTRYRYALVRDNGRDISLREDRFSGKTWTFLHGRWYRPPVWIEQDMDSNPNVIVSCVETAVPGNSATCTIQNNTSLILTGGNLLYRGCQWTFKTFRDRPWDTATGIHAFEGMDVTVPLQGSCTLSSDKTASLLFIKAGSYQED